MRLPYLQVTAETWGKARALSGALGISYTEAFVLILDLWAWALELGDPDLPPTGIVPGSARNPAGYMAGAVGWKGNPEELLAALADLQLIEREPVLRVRGMKRYRATWEKNRRKGHGKDAHPPASRSEPARDPVGTRPQDVDVDGRKEETGELFDEIPPPPKPKAKAKPEKEVDPRHHPTKLRILATFKRVRGADYAFTARDAKALSNILKLPGATEQEIDRRWERGLGEKFREKTHTVVDLEKNWNALAGTGSGRPVSIEDQPMKHYRGTT